MEILDLVFSTANVVFLWKSNEQAHCNAWKTHMVNHKAIVRKVEEFDNKKEFFLSERALLGKIW